VEKLGAADPRKFQQAVTYEQPAQGHLFAQLYIPYMKTDLAQLNPGASVEGHLKKSSGLIGSFARRFHSLPIASRSASAASCHAGFSELDKIRMVFRQLRISSSNLISGNLAMMVRPLSGLGAPDCIGAGRRKTWRGPFRRFFFPFDGFASRAARSLNRPFIIPTLNAGSVDM
jgi:hypothetical protein